MDEMEFKDWLWAKFEEWRRGSTKGPTAYARYLGVKQQLVSAWLNGDYQPRMDSIAKLAEKYPDIYEVLSVDAPVDVSVLPPDDAASLKAALAEIRSTVHGQALSEAEIRALSDSIMARYGWYRKTA